MSGTPGKFGVDVVDYTFVPGATSVTTAWDKWQAITGLVPKAAKVANVPGSFPTTANAKMQAAIDHGAAVYLGYKPSLSLSSADRTAMMSSINALAAACTDAGTGATIAGVYLWNEANAPGNKIPATGTGGFVPMANYYGPTIRSAGYRLGFCSAVASGGASTNQPSYFNNATQTVPWDFGLGDYYATAYGAGVRLDVASSDFVNLCTTIGNLPWGLMEMGTSASGNLPPNPTVIAWLQYCTSVAAAWLNAGKNLEGSAWWEDGTGNGYNLISSASDFRIPYLQAYVTAITPTQSAAFTETQNASDNIAGAAGTLGLWFSHTGGVASTTGTLLVARIVTNDGSQTITGPAGWTLDTDNESGTATSGITRNQIWHYPSNPGSLYGTSGAAANFTYSNTGSVIKGIIAEYTSSPAGYTQVVDFVGAGSNGTTATSMPVSESAPVHPGGLGVVVFSASYSSVPSNSWTTPSGWALDRQVANVAQCYSAYYLTPLPAGAVSVTGTISTSVNMQGWAASLVSFYAAPPPAPASPAVTTLALPAGAAGTAYPAFTMTATSGTPAYTWSASGLPSTLVISSGGVITGTPAAAGSYAVTVTVTDANALSDANTYVLVIAAAGAVGGGTGAPPQLGWPQLIIEAGLSAAAPVAPPGTFILDDPVYGQLDAGNQLGDATNWTDITAYFQSGTVSRPSTRTQGPLTSYQGGTATGVFDNTTGALDPDNSSGPYYGALRPMVPFRVRAVYGSVSYGMWAGFASSWQGADLTYDMGYDEVTIAADDGFKILNGITVAALAADSGGAGDGEDTGARVARILNAAGWYTDHRQVTAGDSVVQATYMGDTALNLLQLTADTEAGELYMDGAGNVVFRHRHGALTDARSTQVQAVFGDLPGTVHGSFTELACIPHRRASDDTQLANDIQATRVGGQLQRAQDVVSQRTYLFPRSYVRSDLLFNDDPTTRLWAQWVLQISVASDQFDAVTIDPLADPANLFPQVLAREIGDRIQVWRRPQNSGTTITQDCFIRSITHAVDAVAGTWSTTWTLQSAARYTGYMILDDAVLGKLDSGNRLAF